LLGGKVKDDRISELLQVWISKGAGYLGISVEHTPRFFNIRALSTAALLFCGLELLLRGSLAAR